MKKQSILFCVTLIAAAPNEFLKEHKKVEAQNRKIQEQEATISQLKKGMEVFAATLEQQAAQNPKGERAA